MTLDLYFKMTLYNDLISLVEAFNSSIWPQETLRAALWIFVILILFFRKYRFFAYLFPLVIMNEVGSQSKPLDIFFFIFLILLFEYIYFKIKLRINSNGKISFWTPLIYLIKSPLRFIISFILVWWSITSLSNSYLRPSLGDFNISRFDSMLHYQSIDKKIAIALSGGGFRAALFHAGVLHQLEKMKVPVSNISAVSGGAIFGSFYVAGGVPQNFLKAVGDGRFLFKRFLFDIQNFSRLIFGFFTTTDSLAKMLDTVFFGKKPVMLKELRANSRINLMVGTTDIVKGLLVGFTPSGYVIHGLPRWVEKRYKRFDQYSVAWENLKNVDNYQNMYVSKVVTASGAFPGVFNARRIPRFSTKYPEMKFDNRNPKYNFYLADGALLDNSGVSLLLAANELGDKTSDKETHSDSINQWGNLDLILESDASSIPVEPTKLNQLEEFFQSANIALEDSQSSIRIVNQNFLREKNITYVRLSPHQFYMPPPFISERELGNIFSFVTTMKRPKKPIKEIIKRIKKEKNYKEKVKSRDFAFLFDIFHERLIQSNISASLLASDLAIIQNLLHVKPFEEKNIGSDQFDIIKLKFEARTKSVRFTDVRPRFFYTSDKRVELALANPVRISEIKNIDLDNMDKLSQDIISLDKLSQDIFSCFQTFMKTGTLDDRFSNEKSEQIFRLGRYITILAFPKFSKNLPE